jgi:hypothetical protein
MALDLRHDIVQSAVAPAPNVPRPGRRAVSLVVGLALMFLLIDAVVHPHTVADLWTMQSIRRLDAPGLLPLLSAAESLARSAAAIPFWLPIIALGLVSLGIALRGRSTVRPANVDHNDAGERRSHLEIAKEQFPHSSSAAGAPPQKLPTPIRFAPRRESARQAA